MPLDRGLDTPHFSVGYIRTEQLYGKFGGFLGGFFDLNVSIDQIFVEITLRGSLHYFMQ